MKITYQLAKHLREVHFGGNWTCSNLKDNVADVTWQQATTKVGSFNTIATLVFHINYYIDMVIKVLEGGPLEGSDKYSFDHPPINSKEDWDHFLEKIFKDAERLSALIEKFPKERLMETMADEKYGSYHRNLLGILEHTHYHLGQIPIIKKLIDNSDK